MDKRIINLILEIDHWIHQPLTSVFIDDGVKICRHVDDLMDKIEEGEIGKWGNSKISGELFQSIYQLIISILDVGEDIADAKFRLSLNLSHLNEDSIWELNNKLTCGELELPELTDELKSIIEGIRNSNSF